jgi:hypothetical protein
MVLGKASILPFSIDPRYGITYFWLGKERNIPGWFGSRRWSDFGGGIEPGESEYQCAAREFHEETMAVLPINSVEKRGKHCRETYDVISHELVLGKYALRVVTTSPGGVDHVTFVKQIPWYPCCQEIFKHSHDLANNGTLPKSHPGWANDSILDSFKEMTEIKLWSVQQLEQMISRTQHHSRGQKMRNGFHHRLHEILKNMHDVSAFMGS